MNRRKFLKTAYALGGYYAFASLGISPKEANSVIRGGSAAGGTCSSGISGTFGNTGTGSSYLTRTTDTMFYQKFTCGETGWINTFNVWLQYATDNNCHIGLYNSTASSLLVSGTIDPTSNDSTWFSIGTTNECIENGTDYILAGLVDTTGSSVRIFYESGTGPWYYFSSSYSSGLPSNFTYGDAAHTERTSEDFFIYADYNN